MKVFSVLAAASVLLITSHAPSAWAFDAGAGGTTGGGGITITHNQNASSISQFGFIKDGTDYSCVLVQPKNAVITYTACTARQTSEEKTGFDAGAGDTTGGSVKINSNNGFGGGDDSIGGGDTGDDTTMNAKNRFDGGPDDTSHKP